MKNLLALRHVAGLLVSFGLAIAVFAWALRHYPEFVGAGIVVLIVLTVANQARVGRERERTNKLIDAAFHDAYAQLVHPPSIGRSYSYGYPAFEIKFRSRLEMEAAAAHNGVFKTAIDNIFKDLGSRTCPFSADQPIFFTYEGHLDELRALYKSA